MEVKCQQTCEIIPSVFIGMCPNCMGNISSDRLEIGLPCERCLPNIPEERSLNSIIAELRKLGTLRELKKLYEIEENLERFSDFFKRVVGHEPWSLQVGWARRVLSGQSFVALAPTGVGKTTFGIVFALFTDRKSYIITPTKLLSELLRRKLEQIRDSLKIEKKILLVSDARSKKSLETQDFDIIITTSMFLARNEHIMMKRKFDFIFVDDVDSYLKQPKNVERVLKLLGLTDDDIDELKRNLMKKYELIRDRNISDKSRRFAEINQMFSKLRAKISGTLVLSSATARARATTTRYFRELFGFEISPYTSSLRNIEDLYLVIRNPITEQEDISEAKRQTFRSTVDVIRRLGNGAFVFVNSEYGKDSVLELRSFLEENGIKSVTYEEFGEKNREKFRKGEINAVIGISSLRNPLCRGIDMPDAVRYAVFAGVPRFVFSVNDVDEPSKLLSLLVSLRPILPQPKKIFSYIEFLRRYIGMRKEDIKRYPQIADKIESIKKFVEEAIADPLTLKKIKENDTVPIRIMKDGRFKFVVADSSAYIQASGRTSRLYIGGLSKGISVLVVDDLKAMNQMKRRLRLENTEIEFKEFENTPLDGIIQDVERDRENIRKVLSGEALEKIESKIEPPKISVMVVESPTKAETIARLIGKPMRRRINIDGNGSFIDVWEVSKGDQNINIIASGGHVFDLPYEYSSRGVTENHNYYSVEIARQNGKTIFIPRYAPIRRCRNCGENFFGTDFCPYCNLKNFEDKTNIVRVIRNLSLEADRVFIATDPDQEGEKIAWDVFLSIHKFGKEIHRIEYHEITQKAIINALENPRAIKPSLVKSQILRRTTDRWIGFTMSEELQKRFGKIWLSAGRVQTPVLGWLIKREEDMKNKIGVFKFRNEELGISDSIRIEDRELSKRVSKTLQKLRGRKRKNHEDEAMRLENAKVKVKISLLSTEEIDVQPPHPFSTSEMLKDASAKLGFSAPETMQLAQSLFESGLITYHRTDSHHVSDAGISIAREFLSENLSLELFVPRKYEYEKEGAHECIRPSRNLSPEELSISIKMGNISVPERAVKLYELIHSTFIASQMRSVRILRGKIKTEISWKTKDEEMKISKEGTINLKILKDGWNKVLFLPIPHVSQILLTEGKVEFETKDFSFSYAPPVPPYTHGTLIDEMKKRGIGRPSTWAHIIKTLIERGYCIERSGYIIITNLGKIIYNHLASSEKFRKYISEDYTRELERKIDLVENEQEDYLEILSEIHTELFH